MKKIFTLICAAVASMSIAASAEVGTTTWVKMLSTNPATAGKQGTTQTEAMATASDGLVFLGHAGTYNTNDQVTLGGDSIAYGTAYAGSSTGGNQMFTLTKTDYDGNFKWVVFSTTGEVYANNLWVKTDANDNVYAAFLFRHTDGHGTETPSFIDATGNETKLAEWNCISEKDNQEHRYYKPFIMKVNAAGTIQWIHEIVADHSPIVDTKYVNEIPAYIYDLAISDNALYVAGRCTAKVSFAKADNTTIDVTPHNIDAEWDGDIQKSVGDTYIAKYDFNGYAEKVFTTSGKVYCESMQKLTVKDGRLFAFISVKGSGDTDMTYTVGDKTYGINKYANMFVAEFDADFNIKWQRLFKGEQNAKDKSTGVLQYMHLNVIDSDLWVSGMGQFTLVNDEDENVKVEMSGTVNQALLMRLDASNGAWKNAVSASLDFTNNRAAITGYYDVFNDPTNSEYLYVYGYTFGGDKTFLRKYKKADLTTSKDDQTIIVNCSGMGTSWVGTEKDGNFYYVARIRNSTTFIGSDITLNPTQFSAVYGCYKVADTSGINSVNADEAKATVVYGTDGAVKVVSATPATVYVYNLMGALVAKVDAQEGETTIALPAGLYIAAGQKVIVK